MKSHRRATALVVALLAALITVGAAPPATQSAVASTGAAVTRWNELVQPVWFTARPGTSGIYVAALMHVAIYDAVVAIDGGAEPFTSSPPVARPADADAAVAAAGYGILAARANAPALAGIYQAELARISDGVAKTNGIAVGAAAAAAVLAARAGDNLDIVVPWVQPTPGPGVFEPWPASPPAEVKVGHVRPVALRSASQFRAGGPPALDSAAYARDVAEVQRLGEFETDARTAAQTQQALFWSENPFLQWNRTLRNTAVAEGMDRLDAARFLAMTTVSFADGLITCFESKYHFTWWRPRDAIRKAATDGNPATTADPTWEPRLMVNHPEYPTGHGCASGAIVETMTEFFGTRRISITVTSTVTQTSRTYSTAQSLIRDIFMARIYGGLHFRSTMGDGFNLGKHVSRYITRNNFQVDD